MLNGCEKLLVMCIESHVFFSKINAKETHYNFSIKLLCSGKKEENIALKKKILIINVNYFKLQFR